MHDIFLDVCRALLVSDPADPLSTNIARTLITFASEGVSDPDVLYKRTLAEFRSGSLLAAATLIEQEYPDRRRQI